MKVSIVMGSISDKEISDKVIEILDKFGVDYDKHVIYDAEEEDPAYHKRVSDMINNNF